VEEGVVRARSFVVLLALAACEQSYVYAPATNTGAEVAGRPASDVSIPPEAPRGDVRVASFGISELEAKDAPNAPRVPALHLRTIVANNSDKPWTVDTREQRVSLDSRGDSRPAYATADAGTPPPLIVVPPGGKRTVDLFFPLPPDLGKADQLPAFDAVWSVQTDTRVVTQRIPFERLALEPARSDVYWDAWGVPYWYDPYYMNGAWFGVALPPVYVGHPIYAHRPYFGHPPFRVPSAHRVR
jgi:hypothetical protein